jgi:hypothetical protein
MNIQLINHSVLLFITVRESNSGARKPGKPADLQPRKLRVFEAKNPGLTGCDFRPFSPFQFKIKLPILAQAVLFVISFHSSAQHDKC